MGFVPGGDDFRCVVILSAWDESVGVSGATFSGIVVYGADSAACACVALGTGDLLVVVAAEEAVEKTHCGFR